MRPPAMHDRVLLLHPYRHVGGPDTFVTNIVRALVPRGTQFWVALPAERGLAERLRALGASVMLEPGLQTMPRSLSPVRLARYFSDLGRVCGRVVDACTAHSIGVVHAVSEGLWPLLWRLGGVGAGRVISVHGLRFASPRWLARPHARIIARQCERVLCVSRIVMDLFQRSGVPDDRLALVPSSVDLDRFDGAARGDAFRRELGIPPDVPLVGTVGSVDPRKGQNYFLEACALLAGRYPAARFAIVGYCGPDGPAVQRDYLDALRARASTLDLGRRVAFVPARDDVPEVMGALDVLVQPSLTEAGPRAPLEAMAMRRPVVGTRVEGTAEEVVDEVTGLLVPAGDAPALARAIARLLDEPETRARMGAAGRLRVEREYSLAMTGDLVTATYDAARAGREG